MHIQKSPRSHKQHMRYMSDIKWDCENRKIMRTTCSVSIFAQTHTHTRQQQPKKSAETREFMREMRSHYFRNNINLW